jgi:excinuclease ABC subunit A
VGRTSRGNPATYTGAFSAIRAVFARALGVDPAMLSFNSSGRCDKCEGAGHVRQSRTGAPRASRAPCRVLHRLRAAMRAVGRAQLTLELTYLEPVAVECDQCQGRRFSARALTAQVRGRSIAEVLDMTIDEAVDFFAADRAVARPLCTLASVGLGYLRLGQPLSTLSGGEAQRLKLAHELRHSGHIYVLDEPTTGLHMADIAHLMAVLHRLVDAGNTVVVIEHNLEVIAGADWVVDMGPEVPARRRRRAVRAWGGAACSLTRPARSAQGGKAGGCVLASGPPEAIALCAQSHTGRFLRAALAHLPLSILRPSGGDETGSGGAQPDGRTRHARGDAPEPDAYGK